MSNLDSDTVSIIAEIPPNRSEEAALSRVRHLETLLHDAARVSPRLVEAVAPVDNGDPADDASLLVPLFGLHGELDASPQLDGRVRRTAQRLVREVVSLVLGEACGRAGVVPEAIRGR